MATDDNVSDAVKLNAIRHALDRAGLGAKAEIELSTKPYESILEGMTPNVTGGSRDEYRRSIGDESGSDKRPPALAAANAEPVDAEVVDDDDELDDWPPDDDTTARVNPFGPSGPPPDELMTFDEAVIRAAQINRHARGAQATVRRSQRALPRGS
jgi:hypothetical protein